MNLVIPLAGQGQRFIDCGYRVPKPFINVNGKTMIEEVINNLNPKNELKLSLIYLFKHENELNLITSELNPNYISLNESTNGAVCSVLNAREYIDNNEPLIIASCDQIIDIDINDFIKFAEGFDGCLLTYKSNEKYHSFPKVENGIVVKTAEKLPISDNANVGIYYFGKGSDFITAAELMIDNKDMFNNEYYIAPVYNYLKGRNIKIYEVPKEKVHLIGTPSLLRKYNDYLKTSSRNN